MTKVISFANYASKKKSNKLSPFSDLIWFTELSEGIHLLAKKDQELIFKNIKYNYYNEYVHYVKAKSLDNSYTFIDYLKKILDLKAPFKIFHGVDFTGEQSMSRLSVKDWRNIADIIVRLSLLYTLNQSTDKLSPTSLAVQYEWELVQMDVVYE